MIFNRPAKAIERATKACESLEKRVNRLLAPGGPLSKALAALPTAEPQTHVQAPTQPDPVMLEEIEQLQAQNEKLQAQNDAITERYAPYEGKIQQIDNFCYPEFVRNSSNEYIQGIKNHLELYYTGADDQPLIGLLLGQMQIINAAIRSPELHNPLAEALRECSRLIVQCESEDEPAAIREALHSISQDFNPHLADSGLRLRVPRIDDVPDSTWMVYAPGSGRITHVRSWCIADSDGTAILHAEVDC